MRPASGRCFRASMGNPNISVPLRKLELCVDHQFLIVLKPVSPPMKNFARFTTAAIRPLPAMLLVLAAASPVSFVFGQDMERSFTVAEGEWVVLYVERAHISVSTWDRAEVAFSAKRAEHLTFELSQADGAITIHGSDEFSEGNGDVSVSGLRADGIVTINGRVVTPDNFSGKWVKTPPAQIVLNVPYRQNLNLRTSGGNIRIDRLQGQFNARASGGDIEADDVDGSVEVRTAGGGIRLQHASGSVDATTSGGSIQLGNVSGEIKSRTSGGSIRIGEAHGTLEARTSGGSIAVGSASGAVHASTAGGSVEVRMADQPKSDSELRASGGNVTVYLRDDLQLDLSANSTGGRIRSDFPDLAPENTAGRARVEKPLNGGGPDLVVRSTGGSIRIRRLDD